MKCDACEAEGLVWHRACGFALCRARDSTGTVWTPSQVARKRHAEELRETARKLRQRAEVVEQEELIRSTLDLPRMLHERPKAASETSGRDMRKILIGALESVLTQ
jgi:hypothetical protein